MRAPDGATIMFAMTRPSRSKVLLVADPRDDDAVRRDAPIRRYRLARLRIDDRVVEPASRFEHLKRIYE